MDTLELRIREYILEAAKRKGVHTLDFQVENKTNGKQSRRSNLPIDLESVVTETTLHVE